MVSEFIKDFLDNPGFLKMVIDCLDDKKNQDTARNCMEMLFALREGELKEAVSLRRQIGNVIELFRPVKAFRDALRKCVTDNLLIDGETPGAIIAMAKEIGGDDMDFSAELGRLGITDTH